MLESAHEEGSMEELLTGARTITVNDVEDIGDFSPYSFGHFAGLTIVVEDAMWTISSERPLASKVAEPVALILQALSLNNPRMVVLAN